MDKFRHDCPKFSVETLRDSGKMRAELHVVVHACHPSIWEVEVGGSEVQVHPWLLGSLKPAWAIGGPVSKS